MFNFLFHPGSTKSVQVRGFLPLLCNKIRSIQEFFETIETRSAEKHVQLEVIQFKALLYRIVWHNAWGQEKLVCFETRVL